MDDARGVKMVLGHNDLHFKKSGCPRKGGD
jgi:hypothetical protein